MYYIDPHIHMISRVTDDYNRMAQCGCVAISEPAFWAGFDRGSAEGFRDYFRHLTEFEPKRAAQFGIRHYSWLCINAKEAENVSLSREVIALIPEFIDRPNVLGLGEIGLNKNTPNEVTVYCEHVELAARRGEMILAHTPHLADKYRGTRMMIDVLRNESRLDPNRVIIDHLEEHTIRHAIDAGYWAGITLYPTTKATPERAVDMIETYGTDRIWVNSAADWGPSDPLAVRRQIVRRQGRHPGVAFREQPVAPGLGGLETRDLFVAALVQPGQFRLDGAGVHVPHQHPDPLHLSPPGAVAGEALGKAYGFHQFRGKVHPVELVG